jgi:Ca-activated chloride channel homolog
MTRLIFIILLFSIPLEKSFSQGERKLIREGVSIYKDEKYPEAEVKFRKALDEKPGLYEAEYDIANSLYKQKKYEEAATEYEKLIQKSNDPQKKADLYHNLGNSNIMTQQFDKGIEAYKNSLRIRPNDEDTRYNLAYALEKLKQQQQQQKDKDKQKQDKDKDKDKQDQDQKDKDQQNKEQQDKQKDQQQNQAQDKKEEQKKDQQTKPDENLNKQEVEQMLNAVQNQEKDTKDKVDRKKAVARPISNDKEW